MGIFDFIGDTVEFGASVGTEMHKISKEEKRIKEGKKRNQNLDEDMLRKLRKKEDEALRNNDAEIMLALGNLYINGNEVGYDPDKALEWWYRAADLGDEIAQYNIGLLHQINPVYENDKIAGHWFEQSAKNGYVPARQRLTKYYEYSKLFKRWLRKP